MKTKRFLFTVLLVLVSCSQPVATLEPNSALPGYVSAGWVTTEFGRVYCVAWSSQWSSSGGLSCDWARMKSTLDIPSPSVR